MSKDERPEDDHELDYDLDISGPMMFMVVCVGIIILSVLQKFGLL